MPWRVDLTPWAGKQIEVFITVATDPASLGLGVWVDAAKVTVDGATVSETSFEDDNHGWTIGPPPEGTENPENGWARAQESFKEGGVVGTNDSVYAGFAFEDMDARTRPKFMGAVMRYLGIRSKPHHSSPSKPVAPPPKAYATKFGQRLLKASKKGRVKVSPRLHLGLGLQGHAAAAPQRQDAGQEGVQHRRRPVQAAHREAVEVRQAHAGQEGQPARAPLGAGRGRQRRQHQRLAPDPTGALT